MKFFGFVFFMSLAQSALADQDCIKRLASGDFPENPPDMEGIIFLEPEGWLLRERLDYFSNFKVNENSQRLLEFLSQHLREKFETELAIVVPPPRSLMAYSRETSGDIHDQYRQLIAAINSSGIIAPNIYDHAIEFHPEDQFYFLKDTHWTPNGGMISAEALRQEIEKTNIVPLASIDSLYSLGQQKMKKRTGDLAMLEANNCSNDLEPAEMNFFEVNQVNQTDGDQAALLFGNVSENTLRVTTVGTSFANAGNFDDFRWTEALRYNLQTQISNKGVQAGAFDTAMLAITQSGEFFSDPPDLLVWETPHYTWDHSAEGHLRHITGGFLRDCVPGPFTLTTQQTIIDATWHEAPPGLAIQDIIHISAENTEIERFDFEVEYPGGEVSKFGVRKRISRMPKDSINTEWKIYVGNPSLKGPSKNPISIRFRIPKMDGKQVVTVSACPSASSFY